MFTNHNFVRALAWLAFLFANGTVGNASVSSEKIGPTIDAYVEPYVSSGNFSGTILVEKDSKTLFSKAYGMADRETQTPNSLATQFHIASMSMQFTAAGILRLCDRGVLTLETPVADFLPATPGAQKITLRHLLLERSGLPDINALSDYNEILQYHQTPKDLVARIAGQPLLFEPGTKFLHEEHSAYNLLALIIEKQSHGSFAQGMHDLVFEPLPLRGSSVDDDSPTTTNRARPYQPKGLNEVEPAEPIHWSGKTGNASICTTVEDEARFVRALFGDSKITASLRKALEENPERVGYGWFKGTNQRFNQPVYSMNGRAPGFASFVLYLPSEKLTVIAFSNIYSSATTTMGYDVASIALGLPFSPFQPVAPPPPDTIRTIAGNYQFGPDFYQKNGVVELRPATDGVQLVWPSGDLSALIPVGDNRFMDRSYWETVTIEGGSKTQPAAMVYGQFRGTKILAREHVTPPATPASR